VADLSLAVTEQTFAPDTFDMDAVEIDRGKVVDGAGAEEWLDDEGRFQPHYPTDDGISPRAFPGTESGTHMTTGLEHDALGRRTEDADTRVEQVDKRERKVETAREQESWDCREFGDPGADTLVISWGSNEGAIREAMDLLEDIAVRFLSVPYLFPRPDLSAAVAAAETTIVVECNAAGQFADILEHDVLERVERITKYNGVRFEAEELAAEMTGIVGEEVAG